MRDIIRAFLWHFTILPDYTRAPASNPPPASAPQDVALVMALEPDAPLLLLPPPGRGATAATEDDAPPAPLPFYMPPPPASGRPWDPTNFYETLDFQIGV